MADIKDFEQHLKKGGMVQCNRQDDRFKFRLQPRGMSILQKSRKDEDNWKDQYFSIGWLFADWEIYEEKKSWNLADELRKWNEKFTHVNTEATVQLKDILKEDRRKVKEDVINLTNNKKWFENISKGQLINEFLNILDKNAGDL